MKKMLLVDLSKCTGCEACVDVCSGRLTGAYSESGSMVRLGKDEPRTVFIPLICEHCREHSCADVCPVEAIRYEPELDIFVVQGESCTACGECTEACPYQGIFEGADMALKCDLCGGDPLCVQFCYPRALQWVEVNDRSVEIDLKCKIGKLEKLRGEDEDQSA